MLNATTRKIIKSTAPVLKEKGVEITTGMYARLFSQYPETKKLFAASKDGQANRLAAAIVLYAENIDRLETLEPSIKAIAKKHCANNVKPEHYPIVGEVLLAAMQDVLGDVASKEVIAAWEEAYLYLAEIFISREETIFLQ